MLCGDSKLQRDRYHTPAVNTRLEGPGELLVYLVDRGLREIMYSQRVRGQASITCNSWALIILAHGRIDLAGGVAGDLGLTTHYLDQETFESASHATFGTEAERLIELGRHPMQRSC